MSLINKMLQDLEARSSESSSSANGYGHVRAVADRSNTHPAWWFAIGSALVVIAALVGTWLWLRPPAPIAKPMPAVAANLAPLPSEQAPLGLKMAPDMPGAATAMAEAEIAKGPNETPAPVAVAAATGPDARISSAADAASPTRAPQAALMTPRAVPMSAPASASAAAPAVAPGRVPAQTPASQLATATSVNPVEPNVPAMLNKQVKELTGPQRAENEYRKASTLMQQQSRIPEAIVALEQALQLDPQHVGARQTLVGLLMESKRTDEAMRKLQEGLNLDPGQQGFAMILARLQVEKGELKPAVDTLQRTLPYAAERDDYQAFLAALLQRQARHKEAIEHYQLVLRHAPQNGLWWMGLAISLQAENRLGEAQEAYNRAKTSNTLSPELHAFVEQKLVSLQR